MKFSIKILSFLLLIFATHLAEAQSTGILVGDSELTPVCRDSAGIQTQLYAGIVYVVGKSNPVKLGYFQIADTSGAPVRVYPVDGIFTPGFCSVNGVDKVLMCDDVNGDTTEIVQFWKVINISGSQVTTLGNWDYSFSSLYTPTNAISCCFGTIAKERPLYDFIAGAGTYTLPTLTGQFTIKVHSVGTPGTPPTLTDDRATARPLHLGDEIEFWPADGIPVFTGTTQITTSIGDTIKVFYTQLY